MVRCTTLHPNMVGSKPSPCKMRIILGKDVIKNCGSPKISINACLVSGYKSLNHAK